MSTRPPSQTEELFRLVSEHVTGFSIILLDPDGCVVSWTEGARLIEGYTPEEILGRHLSLFFLPEDIERGAVERLLARAVQHGSVEDEGWHVRADGTRFWANVGLTAARNADGELTGFVRITRDLSDRQRALDILRASEARYRHLIENATDIIYTQDLEGRLLTVNEAGEKLFGSNRMESVGKLLSDVIVPEHREHARAMTMQKLHTGGTTTYTIDVVTADGRRVPLEVSTQIIYEGGKPVAVQGIARDVTERQRAAEAIEQSERYFRALIEGAVDVITIVNADGTIRYSSPSVERILGYTPEQRRGLSVLDIIHPDDRELGQTLFRRVSSEPGAHLDATLRVRNRDGAIRHVEFRVRNMINDPAVNGLVVNWHDITEQINAEERLVAREHFFRSIIERSTDVLIVTDEALTIRYISPSVTTILGYNAEELIGTVGLTLTHPDDTPKAEAATRALVERGDAHATTVFRVRSSAGDYRVFDVRIRNLLQDPIFQGLVINARDITDSKRTEEALRQSEERFRKIIDTSGEGIGIRDIAGRLTFVNRRFAEMMGYSIEELTGKNIYDIVAPEDRALMEESGERRKHSGKSEQLDLSFVKNDGTRAAVILSASPLYDVDGNYVGALGMLTDITERKHLEEQLRQSQKIEAVGRLAGGIAHDFNNLLTAIRGHVDLLLSELPADMPARADIEEIRKAADRAAALTQQLLAFSRRQILQPRVIEIDHVVREMQTLLHRLIGEDIRLVTRLRSQGACVRADRGQIEQVLMNLAVNSRDAMPNGGSLTIITAVRALDEEFVRSNGGALEGPHLQLIVTDDGDGMDPETLSHVFEPFFTTKDIGKGTGLGLATVYGIVKQSGGYILVESGRTKGTRFEILLPIVHEPSQREREAPRKGKIEASGETVLVAEDEDAVRSLASRILRKRGYHVLEAKHGVDALEIARRHTGRIDLLLTDVVMPVLGGRELGEQLTALRPDVKVLFMSGYTDDVLLQRGVLQNSGRFLEKPFTPDGLALKVREVLETD